MQLVKSVRNIFFIVAVLYAGQPSLFGQDTITADRVKSILYHLASDTMKGRGNGRPELLEAARFISTQFRQAGLQPFPLEPGYGIAFRPFGGRQLKAKEKLTWNGSETDPELFSFYNPEPGTFRALQLGDFEVISADTFFRSGTVLSLPQGSKPLLVWSSRDIGGASKQNLFDAIEMPQQGLKRPVLLVYAGQAPERVLLEPLPAYYNTMLQYNIIGVLPGKTRPSETILISAHYDHEGVYSGRKRKDSILNGANDNASGTTAMLMLADYFAQRNDNERTLIFCAFSGEEMGLLGSRDFAGYIVPETVVAGINLEMLGVPQYGKKKVFVTGYRYSSLPELLEAWLKEAGLKIMREPDEEKLLFERSDNFSFAKKGIPAHTIMASDDDDKCYHQPCDEAGRIDTGNLTEIIKAIAKAIQPLVSGEATPGRIGD